MTTYPNCDISEKAENLVTSLKGTSPTLPTLDLSVEAFSFDPSSDTSPLYTDVTNITLEDLTEVSLEGAGVFDKLMKATSLHIAEEYNANRITGDEYALVYTNAIQAVMNNSTQFVLGKDKARWESVKAQMEARISKINSINTLVQLEKTKLETVQIYYDMENSGAKLSLTKVQVANANQENCMLQASTAKERYNVDEIMPIQKAQEVHTLNCLMPAQTLFTKEQYEAERSKTLDKRSDGLTPISGSIGLQKSLVEKQIVNSTTDNLIKQYNLDISLPAQLNLIKEQLETERAKTLDTRTDGETIVKGSTGKQKELLDQQIDSFQKDAKHKVAKMYLDSWITQKTLDEGLTAPTEFQNTSVDSVMSQIKSINGYT